MEIKTLGQSARSIGCQQVSYRDETGDLLVVTPTQSWFKFN